jgi:hypothetical protein
MCLPRDDDEDLEELPASDGDEDGDGEGEGEGDDGAEMEEVDYVSNEEVSLRIFYMFDPIFLSI